MYFVNKVIGWCISPLGIFFVAVLLAFVLRRTGNLKCANRLVCIALIVLWVLGSGVLIRIIGVPLERMSGGNCVLDIDIIPAADAIVLLGGGMGVHDKCGSPEIFGSADRVWVAARLWRKEKAPIIIASGPGVISSTIPLLRDMGVDESCCKTFVEARNTEEESKFIKSSGVRKILLVTSAWHMPRAKLLFERQGFDVVPCPADFEMSCMAERNIGISDFFPSGDALARNGYCIKEWIALFGYKLLR